MVSFGVSSTTTTLTALPVRCTRSLVSLTLPRYAPLLSDQCRSRDRRAGDAQRHFRSNSYGFFIGDDWKARPNVADSRSSYEYFGVLKEQDDKVANFVFGPNGGLTGSRVEPTSQLYNADKNNFAPRFGFAYSPRYHNLEEKLVIRGGAIYYNRVPEVVFSNTRGNPPFFARYAICCGTAGQPLTALVLIRRRADSLHVGQQYLFQLPSNPALAVGMIRQQERRPIELLKSTDAADTPTAYVYAYSLDFQYKLPYDLAATIGYQGSSSHKLIRLVNQNLVQAVIPPNFFSFAVFIPTPDVNANYNALNARLTRRFARGFQFDVVYRWAKSIDTLSNEGPGAETNQTFPQDLSQERGPSDFDVRHNLNISGLWDLPLFRNRRDFVGKALGAGSLMAS